MSVAIMQPYLFPYIGYFQLIDAVDTFVFYDDVNYIKGGWINRNNVVVSGKPKLFTVPLKSPSQNKLICETNILIDQKWLNLFFKTIKQNYSKAPNYNQVEKVIFNVFQSDVKTISELAIKSIVEVSNYLSLEKNFETSSIHHSETKGLPREDRLIKITKSLGDNKYVNAPGGKDLYYKDNFNKYGIDLSFIVNGIDEYPQFTKSFEPYLSIIDVLMHNSINKVKEMISNYSLE